MAKVMISIPEQLLDAVDRAAEKSSQSRSAFIREALQHRLAAGDAAKRHAALNALRRSLRQGSWRAEDLVRVERER